MEASGGGLPCSRLLAEAPAPVRPGARPDIAARSHQSVAGVGQRAQGAPPALSHRRQRSGLARLRWGARRRLRLGQRPERAGQHRQDSGRVHKLAGSDRHHWSGRGILAKAVFGWRRWRRPRSARPRTRRWRHKQAVAARLDEQHGEQPKLEGRAHKHQERSAGAVSARGRRQGRAHRQVQVAGCCRCAGSHPRTAGCCLGREVGGNRARASSHSLPHLGRRSRVPAATLAGRPWRSRGSSRLPASRCSGCR